MDSGSHDRPPTSALASDPRPPRLFDQVRHAIRTRHMSPRTAEAYVFWAKRYILFQGKRHPKEMGAAEVRGFLSHLALERQVSASTQNQAFSALLFLYRLCAATHKRGYVVAAVVWRSGRNPLGRRGQ